MFTVAIALALALEPVKVMNSAPTVRPPASVSAPTHVRKAPVRVAQKPLPRATGSHFAPSIPPQILQQPLPQASGKNWG